MITQHNNTCKISSGPVRNTYSTTFRSHHLNKRKGLTLIDTYNATSGTVFTNIGGWGRVIVSCTRTCMGLYFSYRLSNVYNSKF